VTLLMPMLQRSSRHDSSQSRPLKERVPEHNCF